jgi:hypothetical protein
VALPLAELERTASQTLSGPPVQPI